MKCFLMSVFGLSLCFFNYAQDCSSLIISEYVEGSGSNKAIEIFNAGEGVSDLSLYSVDVFSNGSNEATSSFKPKGVLLPGEVLVIAHPNSDSTLLSVSDTLFGWSFNGNDAVAIIELESSNAIDVVGVIGEDPGDWWDMLVGRTKDMTMIRGQGINKGIVEWSATATNDWIARSKDDFSFLGSHNVSTLKECVISGIQVTLINKREVEGYYNVFGRRMEGSERGVLLIVKFVNGDSQKFMNQ